MVRWRLAAPCLLPGQPGARQERASPALLGARRGKERDGDTKGRVAPGEGSHQVGEAGCALQPHHGLESGAGGDEALLNLAQNKQPCAAGENSWPVFQADREMVEPFSSGPFPTGSCSSINPLWVDGSGELVPGLVLAPQGWDRASLICLVLRDCHHDFCSYHVDHGSPWMLLNRNPLPRVLLLSGGAGNLLEEKMEQKMDLDVLTQLPTQQVVLQTMRWKDSKEQPTLP